MDGSGEFELHARQFEFYPFEVFFGCKCRENRVKASFKHRHSGFHWVILKASVIEHFKILGLSQEWYRIVLSISNPSIAFAYIYRKT